MVTLADIEVGKAELVAGPQSPSVLLAVWASILSANTGLAENGRQTVILRKWVKSGLPRDPDKVYKALVAVTQVKVAGLYYAQWLDRQGAFSGMEQIGVTWDQQDNWRLRMYKLMHGHGIAWKTASMAAFLLDPYTCEIVPIDRHHCKRFGKGETYARSRKNYLKVERLIWDERNLAGCEHINLSTFAWLKWEQHRQTTGASKVTSGCESHAGLSCRVY